MTMSDPHSPPTTTVPTATPSAARHRALPPLWAVELLDVLGRRGRFALVLATVLSALGLVGAFVVPDVVAPNAPVGALVGLVTLAIGVALALALDALDVRIRGPRHVRSSGGELVALLPEDAATQDAADLADAVLAVRTAGSTLHLGIAPVGEDVTSAVAWAHALAEALADGGSSVLLVDMATGPTGTRGILEVVRDRVPLADVVTYADGRTLAVAGPGADRAQALQALVTLPTVLPADVDVLLVALPPVVTRTAVNASRVLDQVLFVAEANLTSRVELMASLDALRVAGCAPQVILVDEGTYRAFRPTADASSPSSTRIDPVPFGGSGAPVTATPVAPATQVAVDPVAAVEPADPVTAELEAAPEPEPDPAPEPERAARPAPDPDPLRPAGEPSSPLRTVDVLEAAAREQAQTTLAAAQVDTVPLERADVTPLPAASTAPAPEAAPAPEPAPPVAPAPEPPAAPEPPLAPSGGDDRTTELAVDPGPTPAWASTEDEEDLLRTTVQMSAFSEELELRDED